MPYIERHSFVIFRSVKFRLAISLTEMSRSSLDDLESHESRDRLLKNGDDHLNDSRDWETHIEQSSKQRVPNYMSAIAFTSILLNLLLIISSLCLWARTRSPLPPWPNTLYCTIPWQNTP